MTEPLQRGREQIGMMYSGRVLNDRWIPNYLYAPMPGGNGYFISAKHGAWDILSEQEFSSLRSVALPLELHDRLEEKGLIVTEKNADDIFLKYKRWTSEYYKGTSLHIIGVSKRCNLACKYCHINSTSASLDKFDMNADVGRRVVDFIFQSPSENLHIAFQGGEATLNPALIEEVCSYAIVKNIGHHRNLVFSVVSNLVDIPDSVAEMLRRFNVSVCTSIELEHSSSAAFRLDLQGEATADRVLKHRKELLDKDISVPMLMLVERNSVDRLREYVNFFIENGQEKLFFPVIQPLGRAGVNWERVGVDIEEFIEAWRDAMEYIFSLWDEGHTLTERQFQVGVYKLFSGQDCHYMDFRNPCGMVLGQMAYDHEGNIYTCDEGRGRDSFRVGNVFHNTYAEVISSSRSTEIVSGSIRNHPGCETCAYKPFCTGCAVVEHALNGGVKRGPEHDPYCIYSKGILGFILETYRNSPERIKQALAVKYITDELVSML